MALHGASEDPKVTALRESRCLNPHPGQVTDEAFLSGTSSTPAMPCRSSTRWCAASTWKARR